MKTSFVHAASLLALLTFLLPIRGFTQDEDDSPVTKEMEIVNRNFKKLGRQVADPAKKDSSLELVAGMQKAVENSKTLTPAKAEKAPDKAKFMATYNKDLDELSNTLVALKDAISADKADVAKAELDKIGKMKSSSHKELGVGGDRRRGRPGGPKSGGADRGNQNPPASIPAPTPSATPSPVQ